MSLQLDGKVAIVTGASKGIGAGIAKGLAAEGAAVVVNYVSSREGANRIVAQIADQGGRAIAVQGDVGNRDDVNLLFKTAHDVFGAVHIVVNNAGVYKFEPIEVITEAEFFRVFSTNVLSILLTTQEALKHFPYSGGSIINIGAVASQYPFPSTSLYSSAKAAVDTLSFAFAKELATRNIRINTVAPGIVETEGTLVNGPLDSNLKAMIPLGRFGQPEDIAAIVVFLASDAASWLTGERIRVSGGLH